MKTITKSEAEKQGLCIHCISYYPDEPISPPFTTHCRETIKVNESACYCPKDTSEPTCRPQQKSRKPKEVHPACESHHLKELIT